VDNVGTNEIEKVGDVVLGAAYVAAESVGSLTSVLACKKGTVGGKRGLRNGRERVDYQDVGCWPIVDGINTTIGTRPIHNCVAYLRPNWGSNNVWSEFGIFENVLGSNGNNVGKGFEISGGNAESDGMSSERLHGRFEVEDAESVAGEEKGGDRASFSCAGVTCDEDFDGACGGEVGEGGH